MPDPEVWGWFVVASLVLLLTPGPAVLYVVARAVAHGRAAGLVSVLGIHLGTVVHVAAAALGLSALVVSSALAFAVVKYVGAAYLVWIGIRTLLAKDTDAATASATAGASATQRAFRDGFVVNLLNPKTAIFFLAFLPQFVDAPRGGVPGQIAVLGATFIALGIVTDSLFAIAAGSAGEFLRRSRRFLRVQRWLTGTTFIGLGVTAALATRK